jgi:hypothetical protein
MRRALLSMLAALAVTAGATDAMAQGSGLRNHDWRRSDRTGKYEQYSSPQNFAFEMRFGPYYPQVDEEFGGSGPYEQVFDNDPQFYFGVEFDWLPLRIPWVGVLGPGIGWGFTTATGLSQVEGTCRPGNTEGGCVDTGQEASLTIMPMHLSAVFRADELMRRTGVPLVPYAKLGFGLATWSTSTVNGVSDQEINCPGEECDSVLGRDTTLGIHTALGISFSLNWLDPRYAASLDESMGVNHVYVFAEWMNAQLDGLGSRPQMHVGSSSAVFGLGFDM